jgi:hypothetical protein
MMRFRFHTGHSLARPSISGDVSTPITLWAERRQVRGVAPGAASGVEGDAERKAVEDLAHDRLFQIEELIAGLVVERSPTRVTLARRDRTHLDAVAQLLDGVQEFAEKEIERFQRRLAGRRRPS